MSLLLDTHALLWVLFEPHRLGPASREIIEADGTVIVSKASALEIAIKHRVGKLGHRPDQIAELIRESALHELDIEHRHLVAFTDVRLPQGDPFDLLLVAQAQTDSLTFVTADRKILSNVPNSIDAAV